MTPRLIDIEQLAGKLELKRGEVSALTREASFPDPAGYFRGRLLWNEAVVDAWQAASADEGLQAAV
jgi:predicted DNA-binding transcriptional regulator AlpA